MHAAVLKLLTVIHKREDSIDTLFQIFFHIICRNVYHIFIDDYPKIFFAIYSQSDINSEALLNIESVIVGICHGQKSQQMEQRREPSGVSLIILDIIINVVSIQEPFKNLNWLKIAVTTSFNIRKTRKSLNRFKDGEQGSRWDEDEHGWRGGDCERFDQDWVERHGCEPGDCPYSFS